MIITEKIYIKTIGYTDIVDITDNVKKFLFSINAISGQLCVFVKGSTASISTVEYEPGLKKDIVEMLDKIFPYNKNYNHHKTWGCDNGASHLRATLMGQSKTFPVIEGKIPLGTWQQIILIDFDTRERDREIYLNFTGDINAK